MNLHQHQRTLVERDICSSVSLHSVADIVRVLTVVVAKKGTESDPRAFVLLLLKHSTLICPAKTPGMTEKSPSAPGNLESLPVRCRQGIDLQKDLTVPE